jgi:antitoxin (DNA-binding transcriptional repressor) of toxin-antitoxin stability system
MQTVSVANAKAHLSKLLEKVEAAKKSSLHGAGSRLRF